MINSMERVRNIGLMVLNMKEITNKVKKTEKVLSYGLINHHIKEILSIIIYMVTEPISGLTTESIVAIG